MTHSVQHRPAGDGTELYAFDGTLTVKIGANESDGLYELFEVDAPRAPAIPPHRHVWGEAYYMLHGRMNVQVDESNYDLSPGSSITVPPNAPHTFTVLTLSVKFLAFNLSDGAGKFFADLDRTLPRGRPLEEVVPLILEVVDRHDVTLVAPPTLGKAE